jgi:hypothetical protein
VCSLTAVGRTFVIPTVTVFGVHYFDPISLNTKMMMMFAGQLLLIYSIW